jgi:DNA-binding NarL/FixJ family response regulator
MSAAAKLRSAVKEGKLCPEAVEAVLASAGQPARRAAGESLAGMTPREIEILRLITAGHTAKEAAGQLGIAPKTADNHIQSLYSKIGVNTRAGAALYALERGLVARGISTA